MVYYDELVVKPLQNIATPNSMSRGEIGVGGVNRVYLVESASHLFVTAMHHANEVFGTYQSIIIFRV